MPWGNPCTGTARRTATAFSPRPGPAPANWPSGSRSPGRSAAATRDSSMARAASLGAAPASRGYPRGSTTRPWSPCFPPPPCGPWIAPVPSRNGISTCWPPPNSWRAEGASMQRRTFLHSLGVTALALHGAKLFAGPAADPKCLVVFLRGGYDCANVLVPYGSPFYYESRPGLAIPRPDAANAQACVALDGSWGLHPVLKDSLLPLWNQGQVAFVPFAGTHDLSRSHFETQDSIEGGEPVDGSRDFSSGFLNRLAEALGNANPIAFTDGLPLIMKGHLSVPNVSLKQVGRAAFDDRQMAILAEM